MFPHAWGGSGTASLAGSSFRASGYMRDFSRRATSSPVLPAGTEEVENQRRSAT